VCVRVVSACVVLCHSQKDSMLCLKKYQVCSLLFFFGKSLFLTIQLLPQFSFGNRTSQPNSFDHPTLKTVHNWSSGGFDGWF
jgi:hypothetical protein